MKLINFFLKQQKREQSNSPCQEQPASQQSDKKGGSFGDKSVYISTDEQALSIAAYYRGLELRGRTMSQLILEYQKKSPVGNCFITDNYGPHKRLNYLMQVRPNPLMSATELLKQAEIARIRQGNALIYIERGDDLEPIAFWLATSGDYNIVGDTYHIQHPMPGGGWRDLWNVPAEDVIHLRNTFTDSTGWGIPTHKYAHEVLSLAATNDRLVRDNAAKGGRMKILVQEKEAQTFGFGRADRNQMKSVAGQLEEDLYKNDVVEVNNVAQVTPISQSLQAQEISSIRSFSVKEIARMIGVPPILLMDDSNSSYKSPEAATQEFLLRTIQPNIHELEDEINSKLFSIEDFGQRRIHACERNLLRLDPKATAEVAKLQLECGIKTVNELRCENDQPRVANGDDVYVSTNLAVAGSEKLTGTTAATQKGDE